MICYFFLKMTNEKEYETTALHVAVMVENYELCVTLIEEGANVNAYDDKGWTPLHGAAHVGNVKIINLLAENGANVNALTLK